MTGEDRTTPRPGLDVARGEDRTVEVAVVPGQEYDRLRAIEDAARNCSGSPEHFGGCGCTCHDALKGDTHE